jgi:hypothetical protein
VLWPDVLDALDLIRALLERVVGWPTIGSDLVRSCTETLSLLPMAELLFRTRTRQRVRHSLVLSRDLQEVPCPELGKGFWHGKDPS